MAAFSGGWSLMEPPTITADDRVRSDELGHSQSVVLAIWVVLNVVVNFRPLLP